MAGSVEDLETYYRDWSLFRGWSEWTEGPVVPGNESREFILRGTTGVHVENLGKIEPRIVFHSPVAARFIAARQSDKFESDKFDDDLPGLKVSFVNRFPRVVRTPDRTVIISPVLPLFPFRIRMYEMMLVNPNARPRIGLPPEEIDAALRAFYLEPTNTNPPVFTH
jgi:hypothetical protein